MTAKAFLQAAVDGTANVSVSIPAWRTNIPSTTTYYLTCNRTGGTSATAYGRITGVRVA